MQPPEPTDKLLADLHSAQAYMRLAAAFELGRRSPAEPATLELLQAVAATDVDTAVRSAAANACRNLTDSGQTPPSGDTAATVTPSSITALSFGKFAGAAVLSFAANMEIDQVIVSQTYFSTAGLLTILGIYFILVSLAIGLRRKGQNDLSAGILAGLVAVLVVEVLVMINVVRGLGNWS